MAIKRRMVRPEVTFVNLIDVTMVLLLIFMITAPAIQNNIPVELPAGKSPRANISEGVVVTVNAEDEVFIERESIPIDSFQDRFGEIWEAHAGEPVYLRGDRGVTHGTIMWVLSVMKDIGAENVGLVIEEDVTPPEGG